MAISTERTRNVPGPPQRLGQDKRAKLLKLLEQWTRADVMSRVGKLDSDICYALTKIEKADEIKVLLYGTSDLVELAKKFRIRGTK